MPLNNPPFLTGAISFLRLLTDDGLLIANSNINLSLILVRFSLAILEITDSKPSLRDLYNSDGNAKE